MASKKILVDIQVRDLQSSQTIKKTAKAVDELAESTENLNSKRGANPRAQAGLSNAILIETGRVASDANFGIMGVANNIGRLIELFQEFSRTNAGGITEAFRRLKTSILGVGGIIVGVQLLLSFAPRLIKMFKKAREEASEFADAFENLSGSAASAGADFELYIRTIQSSTKSDKEKEDAIHNLSDEFPDFIEYLKETELSLTDVANNTTSASVAIDDFRQSLLDLAVSEAAHNKIRELGAEKFKLLRERDAKAQELGFDNAKHLLESFAKAEESIQESRMALSGTSANTLTQDLTNPEQIITKLHSKRLAQIEAQSKALTKFVDIQKTKLKEEKKDLKLKRDFVAGQLNFDKEILQSENSVSKSLITNKDLQIKAEARLRKELAKLKQVEFAEKQQDRVNAIKDNKDRAKAQKAADKEIADSRTSLNAYLVQIDTETSRKLNQRKLEDLDKATELLEKELNARIIAEKNFEMSMARNDFDRIEIQRQLEEAKTQTVLDGLERQKSAAIVAGEETIGIEEQILNAKRNFSNINKKIDQDEANAKLDTANFVASAITAIAGEGSAVGKAVAVAMATMNTYEATTAALGMKPYSPFNIAQAAATAAFGFVQVKKILQTKLPAGGDAKGTSSPSSISAPEFNVVGASETSQLGMALAQTQGDQKVELVWDDLNRFNKTESTTVDIASF